MLEQIVKPLLSWYDGHARVLPWREDKSPYRVWVSEIMLQQTRVEAVKPFFERFLKALPNVRSLAECSEDELLKLWEGLGYYNRVRNMQKAARVIVEKYAGAFPADYAKLLALPGIGRYTAGAIGSIAFGIQKPAVDGNVLRVLSRVKASYEDVLKQSVKTALEQEVQKIIPKDRAGDFNQALIEIGAVVCVPNGRAKCEECPLAFCCRAKEKGIVEELPKKKRRSAGWRSGPCSFCGKGTGSPSGSVRPKGFWPVFTSFRTWKGFSEKKRYLAKCAGGGCRLFGYCLWPVRSIFSAM